MSGNEPWNEPSFEDEAWVRSLAGRESDTSPSSREAAILRNVIVRQHAESEEGHVTSPGLDRLLFRCRAEGVLDEKRSNARYWKPISLAAAVTLAIGITLIYQLPPPQGEQPVMRGFHQGNVQQLKVAYPGAVAAEIRDVLERDGVHVLIFNSDGAWTLQAELTHSLSPEVTRKLSQQGIEFGSDGKLMVRFLPIAP
ncbi:hypothetical protein FE236_00470 [Mariprofundus erugo]|uniref:hypothetical protein n=1 Tax=Mariprofundus erugo TaxID=2528639 RepID=UPI0010FD5DAB|nr:hypothetical protein [Mariprofundus erugo]TLS78268.1 hypothetical protein FE236_00470 [Mariprofundus erugo]